MVGSRTAVRAAEAAAEMQARLPQVVVTGHDNVTAVGLADVIVLSVPYAAQAATLESIKDGLAGKLLVTVVAPTGEKPARVHRLASGLSAAEEAQAQLEGVARVVAAFQNIGAHHLANLDHTLDCDVLVCGEKREDKALVMGLCQDAGLRGVNAGALQNARAVEALTAVLIAINIIHKVPSAGIRITGIDA